MELKFSLPLLTKATPPKTKGIKNIYVAHSVTFDVPVIERARTKVAMEVYESIERFNGITANRDVELVETKYSSLLQLRTFQGNLYRKISDNLGRDQTEDHQIAFPTEIGYPIVDGSLYLTGCVSDVRNYVAADIARQHDWDLVKQSGADNNIVTAWPTQFGGLRDRFHARNAMYWEEVQTKLTDVDKQAVANSIDMIEAQLKKLIVIDDELWIRCLPPAWCVEIRPDYLNPKTASSYHVLINLKIIPDGFDPDLAMRYFPMDDLDKALELQNLIMTSAAHDKGSFYASKRLPSYKIYDNTALEFDVNEYELQRFGYALTTEIGRYLQKNANERPLLRTAEYQFMKGEMDAVRSVNYITEVHTDVGESLEGLVNIWKTLKKPLSYCTIGPLRKMLTSQWINDMNEVASNRFITLDHGILKEQKPI